MQFSDHLLDNFISPNLSALNCCGANELPELENYFLLFAINEALGKNYPEHLRVTLLNFMRRLHFAADQYRLAQESLKKYVDGLPQTQAISVYNRSLLHFESCILNLYTAVLCLENVSNLLSITTFMFEENDGSDYDRLRKLNNRIKHFDEDIADASRAKLPINVAPIWLTNGGLESSCGAKLSFSEIVGIIGDAHQDAKSFSIDIVKEAADRAKVRKEILKPPSSSPAA